MRKCRKRRGETTKTTKTTDENRNLIKSNELASLFKKEETFHLFTLSFINSALHIDSIQVKENELLNF